MRRLIPRSIAVQTLAKLPKPAVNESATRDTITALAWKTTHFLVRTSAAAGNAKNTDAVAILVAVVTLRAVLAAPDLKRDLISCKLETHFACAS